MHPPPPLSSHYPGIGPLVYGCMGLGGGWDASPIGADELRTANLAVETALDCGIRLFDHADIYRQGKAEVVFGRLLRERPALRRQIVLQSKCGIRPADAEGPGRYDFSRAWLLRSVEGSLQRLGVESLDILLLHRPDPLCEPHEVAEAFRRLRAAGKVRHFGVSNMAWPQIAFLQEALDEPLVVNQIPFSLLHLDWLEAGVLAAAPGGCHSAGAGTLEHCRRRGVQIQAWGSLCQGWLSGRDLVEAAPAVRETSAVVKELAAAYGTSAEAIVLAWLLRHPAGVQAVIGSTAPARIRACALAVGVSLSREDWYRLYVSARGAALP